MEGPEDVGGEGTLWEREDHQEGGAQFCSRSPCCVLLALPWNTTNENPSTDKLSRAINYKLPLFFGTAIFAFEELCCL